MKRSLAVLGRVLIFVLSWSLLLAPSLLFFRRNGIGENQLLLEFTTIVTLLIATWGVRFYDRDVSIISIGLDPNRAGLRFVIGTLIGAAWVGITLLALAAGGWLHWTAAKYSFVFASD